MRAGMEVRRRRREGTCQHHAARQTSSHAMAARTLASSQTLYEAYIASRNELPASPGLPRASSGDTRVAEDVGGTERRSPRLPALDRRVSSSIAGAADKRVGQVPPPGSRAPRLCRSGTSNIHDNAGWEVSVIARDDTVRSWSSSETAVTSWNLSSCRRLESSVSSSSSQAKAGMRLRRRAHCGDGGERNPQQRRLSG